MNIIETYDLSKSYGRMVALDQVNLAASAGAILGVVGAKGSGKTTLLRVLATLSTPTAGDALIAGSSILGSPSRIRRIIGYMPQHFGIYPDMTVDEYLHFFAESYAVPHAEQMQLISDRSLWAPKEACVPKRGPGSAAAPLMSLPMATPRPPILATA